MIPTPGIIQAWFHDLASPPPPFVLLDVLSCCDFVTLLSLRLTNRVLKTIVGQNVGLCTCQRKFWLVLHCENDQPFAAQPRLIIYEENESVHLLSCTVDDVREVYKREVDRLDLKVLESALQAVHCITGSVGNSIITQVAIGNPTWFGKRHGMFCSCFQKCERVKFSNNKNHFWICFSTDSCASNDFVVTSSQICATLILFDGT